MNKDVTSKGDNSVLIVHHGQGIGGGLIALIGLIEELKKTNHVRVLSIFDGIAVDYLRKSGVAVIVPTSKFYSKYYQLFIHSDASYFNIIDSIRGHKALLLYFLSKYYFSKKVLNDIASEHDVIYLNSTFISDWAYAAKGLGKKVIIHIREPLSTGLFGIRRKIIRSAIEKYCDAIVAISHDNSRRVGLEQKTTVVYDPVVTVNRSRPETEMKATNTKSFVYLGGMSRIKGFEQLVKSLEYLDADVRIYFLGGNSNYTNNGSKRILRAILDPFFIKSQRLISRLRESDNIVYIGLVDDVFNYYENSIAVICPFSKPHASLPILEAFSVGKPVIVSDVKGMEELVDETNGVFFTNLKPESLATKINEMARITAADYGEMRLACFRKYKWIREETASVASVVDRVQNIGRIRA